MEPALSDRIDTFQYVCRNQIVCFLLGLVLEIFTSSLSTVGPVPFARIRTANTYLSIGSIASISNLADVRVRFSCFASRPKRIITKSFANLVLCLISFSNLIPIRAIKSDLVEGWCPALACQLTRPVDDLLASFRSSSHAIAVITFSPSS